MSASSASPARPGRTSRPCRSPALDGPAYDLPPTRRAGTDLADPFPRDDPLPGAYELHLPADDVTIWYTITEHEGQEVISVQQVSVDI